MKALSRFEEALSRSGSPRSSNGRKEGDERQRGVGTVSRAYAQTWRES